MPHLFCRCCDHPESLIMQVTQIQCVYESSETAILDERYDGDDGDSRAIIYTDCQLRVRRRVRCLLLLCRGFNHGLIVLAPDWQELCRCTTQRCNHCRHWSSCFPFITMALDHQVTHSVAQNACEINPHLQSLINCQCTATRPHSAMIRSKLYVSSCSKAGFRNLR